MSRSISCVLRSGHTVEWSAVNEMLTLYKHAGKNRVTEAKFPLAGLAKMSILDEGAGVLKLLLDTGFIGFLGVAKWEFTPFLPPAVVGSREFAELQDELISFLSTGKTVNQKLNDLLALGRIEPKREITRKEILDSLHLVRGEILRLIKEIEEGG